MRGLLSFSLFIALVLPGAVRAASSGESPVTRTRELFAGYRGPSEQQPGIEILTAQRRSSWFSPRVVQMLQRDARCGDLRNLDYDPLLSGQDPALSGVDVSTEDEGGRQIVTARYENAGKPGLTVLTWVKSGGGWRIDEIEMPDGKRMTSVLSESCEPFQP